MIWESAEWKRQLAQDARKLSRLSSSPLRERNLVEMEKTIFVAAYMLRKLAEARKVTDKTRNTVIAVRAYPRIVASHMTHFNWHDLERHFAFDVPRDTSVDVLFLANQLIHSYVFSLVTPKPKSVEGFMVSSDRERESTLRYVELTDFIEALNRFANDDPTNVRWQVENGREVLEVN